MNLAVAYAMAGATVTLIDSDPNQTSCVKWSGLRPPSRPPLTTVALSDPGALRNNINRLSEQSDVVIIDGTPALSELTGTIMLISDLVLLPIKASDIDAWAFNDQFLPTLRQVRALKQIDCRVIRNAVKAKESITREVNELLERYDIPVLHRTVGDRTIFKHTPRTGLGVMERDKSVSGQDTAAFEVRMLQKEVHEVLTLKQLEV